MGGRVRPAFCLSERTVARAASALSKTRSPARTAESGNDITNQIAKAVDGRREPKTVRLQQGSACDKSVPARGKAAPRSGIQAEAAIRRDADGVWF